MTNNTTTLQDCGICPFYITQVHKNGTIIFQCTPHIVEHFNIPQVKPNWHQASLIGENYISWVPPPPMKGQDYPQIKKFKQWL